MARLEEERRGARTATTAIGGAGGGVIAFLFASQISSSWMTTQSDAAMAVTLVLAAALTAAVVTLAIRHPLGALWAGFAMVALVVVGFASGDVVHLQGPLSLLHPQRLALHGGRSIFVVGLAAAALTIATNSMMARRR